jgi:prepilin-type N-terminal cleavage/methylation domain-containing protein
MKLTKNPRNAGFTLVEIMIVVAIIGLLAAIAIPNFARARASSQANACINNLRQLYCGTQQFAMETGKSSSDSVNQTDILPYIKLNASGSMPPCPAGGTYDTSWIVTNSPQCSLGTATPAHALP